MHVFLSGRDDLDLSGVIDRTLGILGNPKITGYRTVSVDSAIENARSEVYITAVGQELIRDESRLIGVLWDDGVYTAFPEVFDGSGKAILDAIDEEANFILMDRVGLFEAAAPLFCAAVLKRLDNNTPVFGVVQRKDTPFLDAIRNHPDVQVIEVAEANINQVPELAEKIFKGQ